MQSGECVGAIPKHHDIERLGTARAAAAGKSAERQQLLLQLMTGLVGCSAGLEEQYWQCSWGQSQFGRCARQHTFARWDAAVGTAEMLALATTSV